MKNKIDLVISWLKKGERDLRVAMRELAQKEPFTDIVCFHAMILSVLCPTMCGKVFEGFPYLSFKQH